MALAASRRIRSLGRTGCGAGACVVLLVCFAAVALGAAPGGGKSPAALSGAKKESCSGADATIVGTQGVDRLEGTRGTDVIVAGGGDDVIFGGRGRDIICVNGGADRVVAGAGDDVVVGGSGADVLSGGPGADRLLGGSGADRLFGRAGADRISGNNGADVLGGGPGEDRCLGGRGVDSLSACESGDASPVAGNAAPVGVDDAAPANEDAPRSVAVLANDTDPDGNRLSVQSIDVAGTRAAVAITDGGDTIGYDPRGKFNDLAAGATATETFSYRVSDGKGGTDTARVTVTVNGADDRPAAVGDSATRGEDSGAAAIDVLTNDTDVDNGPKSISSASNPAGGTVAISGGGSGLNYTPDPNYCNDPSAAPTDDFTYTLNGGSTATVSVSVTCSQDVPDAVNDSRSVGEDSGATNFDVLANDTEPDGETLEIINPTTPANGLVEVVQGSPDLVRYTPDPNYCNDGAPPDTFQYTVDDGNSGFDTATVSVAVTCVSEPPVVDLNGVGAGIDVDADFIENAGAVTLAPATLVTDPDDANIESATVTLTNQPDGGAESLTVDTTGTSITAAAYVPGTGVLALSGADSKANYQQVLRTAAYANSSDTPNAADRLVNFVASDGEASSAVATATVSVAPANDAPVVDLNGGDPGIDNSAAFTEDAPAVTLAPVTLVTDSDDANIESATITLTTGPDEAVESLAADTTGTSITMAAYVPGTGVLALSGSASLADYQQVLRTVTYDNSSNTPDESDRSVQFRVHDGDDPSAVATSTVSVTAVDDGP